MAVQIGIPRQPLTDRQWRFLSFLNAFLQEHKRRPTFREIAIGLGISSKGSVSTMIERLQAKGVLDRKLRPSFKQGEEGRISGE